MLFDVYEDFYRETDIVTNMCGHETNLSESILFQVRLGLIENYLFRSPGLTSGLTLTHPHTSFACLLCCAYTDGNATERWETEKCSIVPVASHL